MPRIALIQRFIFSPGSHIFCSASTFFLGAARSTLSSRSILVDCANELFNPSRLCPGTCAEISTLIGRFTRWQHAKQIWPSRNGVSFANLSMMLLTVRLSSDDVVVSEAFVCFPTWGYAMGALGLLAASHEWLQNCRTRIYIIFSLSFADKFP